MTPALFLTAYDRPQYLRPVLESWMRVRGLERWHLVFRIEPGMYSDEIQQMCRIFLEETGHLNADIIVNPTKFGVLHHPWVGFEELFKKHEFVVRTEDDLVVSADILEYFEWAEKTFRHLPEVASIHGFTFFDGDSSEVIREGLFNPLVWGTWRDTWNEIISPTWDHDYSTNNGTPGVQAGWDWNLNTRIYPQLGLVGAYPLASRVSNIGLVGTHSTPENYRTSVSFRGDHGRRKYRVVAEAKASEVDIT